MGNKSVQLKSNVSQGVGLMAKSSTKTNANTNIAAVEPYHHVPSVKSNQYAPAGGVQDAKRNHRKSDQHSTSVVDSASSHRIPYPPYQPPVISQKEAKTPPSEDRVPPYPNQTGNVPDEDNRKNKDDGSHRSEDGVDSWPNKFDAKYQTLPGGGTARYSHSNGVNLNRYDYRRPAEGIESTVSANGHHEVAANQKFAPSDKRLTDDGFNGNVPAKEAAADAGDSGGVANPASASDAQKSTNSPNLQSTSPMQPTSIVRSMPIQASSNKGLATPLSNSNYVPRCTAAANANNFTRYGFRPVF